jgi:hypothetical protein
MKSGITAGSQNISTAASSWPDLPAHIWCYLAIDGGSICITNLLHCAKHKSL